MNLPGQRETLIIKVGNVYASFFADGNGFGEGNGHGYMTQKTSTERSTKRRKELIEKGIREVRGIDQPVELHGDIKRKIKELYPKK